MPLFCRSIAPLFKRQRSSLWLTLALLPLWLSAAPLEVSSFEQVNQVLQSEDLLILDIDNTLIIPKQQLGSDQWFYQQIQDYQKSGLTPKAALERAIKDWEAVQALTQVLPCEPCTAQWIQDWQKRGLCVMGLTTRGLGMSQITVSQLESLDIDLQATAPSQQEMFFLNPRAILLRRGILFTAGTHKGQALAHLLDALQLRPKRVVFVNDKATHIAELQSTVEQRGFPFLGLRYGAVDRWVSQLNPQITKIQWNHFGKILSDEEAQLQLTHCPCSSAQAG